MLDTTNQLISDLRQQLADARTELAALRLSTLSTSPPNGGSTLEVKLEHVKFHAISPRNMVRFDVVLSSGGAMVCRFRGVRLMRGSDKLLAPSVRLQNGMCIIHWEWAPDLAAHVLDLVKATDEYSDLINTV